MGVLVSIFLLSGYRTWPISQTSIWSIRNGIVRQMMMSGGRLRVRRAAGPARVRVYCRSSQISAPRAHRYPGILSAIDKR